MSIRFGIISDSQYSDIDDIKGRQYRKSLEKLNSAISILNGEELDFIIQLGDFIDHGYKSFAPVLKEWSKLKHKSYHVLGNHDFCVKSPHKQDVLKTLGMGSAYYFYKLQRFRFIILNGNGLSLNAFDDDSEMYKFSEEYWESLNGESQWWNGAVDEEQLKWLKLQLTEAAVLGDSVMIFCHYPLISEERFVLWNNREVLKLLEDFDCVKVWMNGHFHEGAYAKEKGCHFVTVKGMVQFEETTFAIADLSDTQLKISGFGAEESRILDF